MVAGHIAHDPKMQFVPGTEAVEFASRADAERIEKLENDISTLIHDKRQLSEECLKLRTTVQAFPQSKKELAVRVAELESQLTKARKEAAANEEHLTEAFNLVIRNLEGEVTTLTTQRDEVRRRGDHTKMRPHTALTTAALLNAVHF